MKYEISDAHLKIIGDALGAQAYGVVAPVIAELQRQYNEQAAAAAQNVVPLNDDKAA